MSAANNYSSQPVSSQHKTRRTCVLSVAMNPLCVSITFWPAGRCTTSRTSGRSGQLRPARKWVPAGPRTVTSEPASLQKPSSTSQSRISILLGKTSLVSRKRVIIEYINVFTFELRFYSKCGFLFNSINLSFSAFRDSYSQSDDSQKKDEIIDDLQKKLAQMATFIKEHGYCCDNC